MKEVAPTAPVLKVVLSEQAVVGGAPARAWAVQALPAAQVETVAAQA